MLSRALRRALLETHGQSPPTFLLPWTAGLHTVTTTSEAANPPPLTKAPLSIERRNDSAPSQLSSSVRELLPLLQSQAPHYITAHIHGFPYVLTQGDTLRLPFLMHGVEPGDILRLNCAVNLGSRDFTLKAPAATPRLKSPANSSTNTVDPTTGTLTSHSMVMPDRSTSNSSIPAPHFIPHIAKGKFAYLDDRLFVCRAVVMGVESEPMRIKEKTKRRQRHVRKIKSKHRFTILKIKELRVKSLDEIESEVTEQARGKVLESLI